MRKHRCEKKTAIRYFFVLLFFPFSGCHVFGPPPTLPVAGPWRTVTNETGKSHFELTDFRIEPINEHTIRISAKLNCWHEAKKFDQRTEYEYDKISRHGIEMHPPYWKVRSKTVTRNKRPEKISWVPSEIWITNPCGPDKRVKTNDSGIIDVNLEISNDFYAKKPLGQPKKYYKLVKEIKKLWFKPIDSRSNVSPESMSTDLEVWLYDINIEEVD